MPKELSDVQKRMVLVGSVLPDADLLWFFLVDNQMTHHHSYLSHRPALWFGLTLIACAFPQTRFLVALALGALLHLMLDSLTGAVDWGWPVATFRAPLAVVPATHDLWVLSFLTHWTFGVELLICGLALWLWRRTPASPR